MRWSALTNKKLIGARDPLGIRPLVLGELDGCPILASETCALDIIGANFVRDVENGEVVVIDDDGVEALKPFPPQPRAALHLRIRLLRPARLRSSTAAPSTTRARRWARSSPGRRRPPPTSSSRCPTPACRRRSAMRAGCGLPFELGIIRNHYVGRTFIQPTQAIRELGVRMKHNANRAVVDGKRVVLIDDSIVRGTTSVKIVQMMRDAGAREVHFRISSPPITHPDFYGIDTPERDKLLAARMDARGDARNSWAPTASPSCRSTGIYRAMGCPGRNAAQPQFTDHCFTGDYPTRLTDMDGEPERRAAVAAGGSGLNQRGRSPRFTQLSCAPR